MTVIRSLVKITLDGSKTRMNDPRPRTVGGGMAAASPLNGGPLPAIDGRSFLLDTNVLLHDANALNVFSEHNVILTVDVLEELDRFKRGNDELARNARRVARTLDSLRDGRPLSQGVPLEAGGKLYVFVT